MNADALYNRGLTYSKQGRLDEAITDYTKAIRLNPRLADVYYARGYAYSKKGEKGKAEADFAQAKKLGYKPP
jgi:tetratricopeptide (TPR) repeat protein